jgi:hypothetical protein
MKPLLFKVRSRQADAPPVSADDNLGRGMEIALLLLVFIVVGRVIDAWLGVFPVATIAMILIGAVGVFANLKYRYTAAMERLEAERAARHGRRSVAETRIEDAA